MFAERCKTAGEKIHRTVENVEGLYLLKIRPTAVNFGDQFRLDDPYGHDSGGEWYIKNFLRGFYHQSSTKAVPGSPPRHGYLYIEALDPQDGKRYRYTGARKAVRKKDVNAPGVQFELKRNPSYDLNIYEFVLDKAAAIDPAARYGVTYDDISTKEDREYWIAGSSLRVIDLQTNEVIAERIGYMMDWAQGSRAGGRSPWLFAADTACPGFQRNPLRPLIAGHGGGSSAQTGQTLDFVEKTLKPSLN
ncbi:hypothetical protein [Variovorax sp. JS1663]|uniref:hypothetical protein n=1 Tax=Variovorax sp. JS1663 TaxID=1851577 RepID=UPI000B3433BF|nr:hypothetical protein [Variovorax sp. JS1663]OUL97930.1 hypothetical protein A8M77_34365 [Variovorax sp. JS1663]